MVDTEQGGPRPPGRAGLRTRDMIGALVVLLVIVGGIAAVTRGCSFDPGAPEVSKDTAPSVDVSAKLRNAASSVTFPVRQPAVPREWRPNSSSTVAVGSGAGGDVVVRVGWLTPAGRYVQLSQSGAAEADVLTEETGESGPATGDVAVDGTTWAEHPSWREERAWVTTLGGVVTVITGSATAEEFEVLAAAVAKAEPLAGASR